jgi:hypothetical protein
VTAPVAIKRDHPQFPAGVRGMILVQDVIGKDDLVKKVTVVKSMNPDVDRLPSKRSGDGNSGPAH